MAEWKKVIVSGSQAELAAVTASLALRVGTNQQITTSQTTTFLTGSFTGSFTGNGAGLTNVTATAIFPTTAKTDLATTDQIYINDGANKYITYGNLVIDLAGSGQATSNLTTTDTGDSLALTSQITVTGVTASLLGNASTATTATNATNTAITDTTTGTGPYYITFVDNTSGNLAQRVDSTGLTYNATTNTITATSSFAVSSSRAISAATADVSTLSAITDTTTGTGPYYITFVDAASGNVAERVDSTGLTYNATTNTITATASYAAQALSASFASTAPYSGLSGVPVGIVSSSVLAAGSGQGAVTLTTNGVSSGDITATGLGTSGTPTFAGVTANGNIAINNGTSTALTTTGTTAAVFNANATTLNIGGAATAINIGASTGTSTFNHNVNILGTLYVQGSVTAISSSNLFVADQFITIASGSAGDTDGGIIIDRGSFAAGNIAYGYDTVTNRWGFQDGLVDTTNAINPAASNGVSGSFVGYVFTEAAHGATKPITGEFAKEGAIYTNTDGTVWIYA